MTGSLFAKEEAAIEAAKAALADERFDLGTGRDEFERLLKDYQKLYKTGKRLMRLSDRNEHELAALAQKQRLSGEEIAQRNRELVALSNKLAKYLSPQVYDSIFTGKQEVKLASQRKKLTVFFSDIAGFTEITDRMESEDLTQILNHYLTEMSQVALEHGATIDKFIGDAIMIFFGDPESRGVGEDAANCVKMAIAMRDRMDRLAEEWSAMGIERPLTCRMGIHTGYCTVGNFGSDDRMDYTIIGGAVNLASRLEALCENGGILISYETYAHVRDLVKCEELGKIDVKGLAQPVRTYAVGELLAESAQRHNVDLPNLQLNMRPAAMSENDRERAKVALRLAIEKLDQD